MIRPSTRGAREKDLQVCRVDVDPLAAPAPATDTARPKRPPNGECLGGVMSPGGLVDTRGKACIANGSRTIEGQHVPLESRNSALSELLRQNEDLRQRLESVVRRATEDAERQLRRLGADLHDGPAQLLALALLKLDLLAEDSEEMPGERQMIRSVLQDALSEIRNISAGLALPAIDKLSLAQALIVVATEHERRTSTRVSCEFPTGFIDLSYTIKLCLCRFVQEGLSNAFKHAGGVGQTVSAIWTDTMIEVAVGDAGPGLDPAPREGKRPALGLIGLHNRLESLGGHLTITGQVGGGTRLTAYLPVGAGGK
jgi:signal transduction histidine kinase